MRLGTVQRNIMAFLSRCGESGAFIGSTTKAEELRGYDLEQVERALTGLLRRRIIRREGIRYLQQEEQGGRRVGRAFGPTAPPGSDARLPLNIQRMNFW